MPLERNKNGSGIVISIINFENTKVRKIVNSIKETIKLLYGNTKKISKLIEGADYYRRAIIILRKKSGDYTSKELSNFSL